MKRAYVILAVLLITCFFSGCKDSRSEVTLKGQFIEVSTEGEPDSLYLKDYLMMSCCREWPLMTSLASKLDGAEAVEGFEFAIYDENAKEIRQKNGIRVRITPTEQFCEETYEEIEAINLKTLVHYPVESDGASFFFTTDMTGIYLLVKYGEGSLWISDIECNGECRTCSDDW